MADNNQNGQNAQQNNRPPMTSNMNNRPAVQPPVNTGSSAWWVVGGVIIVVALIAWAFVAARRADKTGNEAVETATTTSTINDENASVTPSTVTPAVNTTTAVASANVLPSTVPVGMSADASQLTVPTPQAAGSQVEVSNMVATVPTWVVIYENNNGKAGNALGAALFLPGHTSSQVELLRNTVAGQTYLVSEAQDTDGTHVFSLKGDAPVLDQNNSQIWVQFQAN